MTVTVAPQKIFFGLLGVAALLTTIHVAVLVIYFLVGDPGRFDFVRQVDFDYEGNIPTLFATLLLWTGSVLFYLIARQARQQGEADRLHWLGLAGVFAFLGLDEGVGIHEEVGDLMESVVPAEGLLYFPWFIPYSLALLVLAIAYWSFLRRLPVPTRRGVVTAAALYVIGAVGFDVLGAREADLHGTTTVVYSVLYTVEEVLEMAGVILLIRTLLTHLERTAGALTLRFDSSSDNDSIKDPT